MCMLWNINSYGQNISQLDLAILDEILIYTAWVCFHFKHSSFTAVNKDLHSWNKSLKIPVPWFSKDVKLYQDTLLKDIFSQ